MNTDLVIPNFPSITDHVLVWIFGMIMPFLSGLQSEKLKGDIVFNEESRRKIYLSNAMMLMISGAIVMGAWLFHKRAWSSLGLNTHITYTLILYLYLTIFLLAYFSDLLFSLRKRKQKDQVEENEWFEKSSFLPEKRRDLPSYIILCLAAGIFEEIIYRGFMVTYFLPEKDINTSILLIRISAPAALFSMAHYYQGWLSVLKIFIFSLLLSLIYVESGSLIPTIIIHVMVDLISGLAFMKSQKTSH